MGGWGGVGTRGETKKGDERRQEEEARGDKERRQQERRGDEAGTGRWRERHLCYEKGRRGIGKENKSRLQGRRRTKREEHERGKREMRRIRNLSEILRLGTSTF